MFKILFKDPGLTSIHCACWVVGSNFIDVDNSGLKSVYIGIVIGLILFIFLIVTSSS